MSYKEWRYEWRMNSIEQQAKLGKEWRKKKNREKNNARQIVSLFMRRAHEQYEENVLSEWLIFGGFRSHVQLIHALIAFVCNSLHMFSSRSLL